MTLYRILSVFLSLCLVVAIFPLFLAAQTAALYLFTGMAFIGLAYIAIKYRRPKP